MPRSTKPQGQPTRGKTAANRLRRVDNFILLYEHSILTRTDGLFVPPFTSNQQNEKGWDADAMFVDLGYGFDARTTLESAGRFRRVNPNLKILGVEIDRERVEAALPHADEKTFFRLGGFNLPLQDGEYVRLVRAFNVLRQYDEGDLAPAYETLAQYILPGGLMIEGTSNPFGSIWCANVVRKVSDVTPRDSTLANSAKAGEDLELHKSEALRSPDSLLRVTDQWKLEALVFSTNFRLGFEPEEFQTILPKNLIHRVVPGESIHDFFEAWKRSAKETASMKVYGTRQWFAASAESLAQKGYRVNLQRKFLAKGYLVWEA